MKNPIVTTNTNYRRGVTRELPSLVDSVPADTIVDIVPGNVLDIDSETTTYQSMLSVGQDIRIVSMTNDFDGYTFVATYNGNEIKILLIDRYSHTVLGPTTFTTTAASHEDDFQYGLALINKRQFLLTYPSVTDKHLVGKIVLLTTDQYYDEKDLAFDIGAEFDIDDRVGVGVYSAIAKSPCTEGPNLGKTCVFVGHNGAELSAHTIPLSVDTLFFEGKTKTPATTDVTIERANITYPTNAGQNTIRAAADTLYFGGDYYNSDTPVLFSMPCRLEFYNDTYEFSGYANSETSGTGKNPSGTVFDVWSNLDGVGSDAFASGIYRGGYSSGSGYDGLRLSKTYTYIKGFIAKSESSENGGICYSGMLLNQYLDGYGYNGISWRGLYQGSADTNLDFSQVQKMNVTLLPNSLAEKYDYGSLTEKFVNRGVRSAGLLDQNDKQIKFGITLEKQNGAEIAVLSLWGDSGSTLIGRALENIPTGAKKAFVLPGKKNSSLSVLSLTDDGLLGKSYKFAGAVVPASSFSRGDGVTLSECEFDTPGKVIINE